MTTETEAPDFGRVTWDSEGAEGGRFHSRVLHVPGATSGLTIGRGYDMKLKKQGEILANLLEAGVGKAEALTISRASGLQGDVAKKFIKENGLQDFEISPAGQKILFRITYAQEAAESKRIATKPDVTAKYGPCDWDALDPAIRDLVIDLKFRGDYTPAARSRIQRHIARGDLEALARDLASPLSWPNVPKDRFERRRKFAEEALIRRRAAPGGADVPMPMPT